MTVENERNNEVWGDTLEEKPSTITRVYSMNVNGLTLDRRGGQFDTLCKVHKEVGADIMCGQEHNLDSEKTQVRSILFETTRQHWNRSKLIFGTTPISFTSMYKPGGTFMLSSGDITGRVLHQAQDKWGRWVSQTYQGKHGMNIMVISAYQVVGKPAKPGCITTASQQQSLLLQAQDVFTNPRTAFRRDLHQYLQAAVASGHEILLVGDFNEPFGSDLDGMTKLAAAFQLVDLMSRRHSSAPPATYARGRQRLDYVLATQHVADALSKSGYEPFNARFHTDHRAYFLDFDTDRLFGSQTQALGAHPPRILKSSNIPQVTQYLQHKFEFLTAHNVFRRAQQLLLPGNRHAFAERLDRDIVAASLAAEAKTRRYGDPAWSLALVKARQQVSLLSKCLSMARTGLDHRRQIQAHLEKFPDAVFHIPLTVQECKTRLREAKRVVKEIVQHSFERRDDERNKRIAELESAASGPSRASAKVHSVGVRSERGYSNCDSAPRGP